MIGKREMSIVLLVLGAFGLLAAVSTGVAFTRPASTTAFILMMIPYLYIQFAEGRKSKLSDGVS